MVRFGGYNSESDVLVNETRDGSKLEKIYADIKGALDLWNNERTSIASLVSYQTTAFGDAIPQGVVSDFFSEASEFGVAQSIREPATALKIGYTFKDYDLRLAYTWKFLRNATAEQVYAQANHALEADNALVNGTIMKRLFNPATETNDYQLTCYGLWNNDGISPMPYLGNTFDGTHTHYLASGNATLDSADVEDLMNHVRHHGYTRNGAARLLILANSAEAELIQSWRAGEESRSGGPKAKHDFIHSSTAPPNRLVGMVPGRVGGAVPDRVCRRVMPGSSRRSTS